MVKIKINEQESYDIQLPEVMDMGQLIGVVERLKLITKMSQNEFIPQVLETPNIITAKRKYNKASKGASSSYIMSVNASKILLSNRFLAIQFIRLYYERDTEQMNQFLEANGLNGYIDKHRTWLSKKVHQYIKHWDIKPEEVGLIGFPSYQKSNKVEFNSHGTNNPTA